jgi:hypothetical protein
MGFWDWMTSTTPAGMAGNAAQGMAEGIFNGIDRIIRDFKLPPEQLVEYEKFKLEAFTKAEDIAASDRNSARQREMAVRDWTPKILAYGVTVGFFGILFFMLEGKMPEQGHDVLLVMLGSLGAAWTGIVAYYFGSSAGSANKDRMMERSIIKAPEEAKPPA